MNDSDALDAIKDSLQTNLTDARQQYTNESRSWIHTDRPLTSASYPRIQVRKRGPTETKIISIGEEFWEHRIMTIDIQFWSSSPFKWKNDSDVYIQDEQLVRYYLDQIWTKLKANQPGLKATYGITGLKPLDEEAPYVEPDTNLHTGIISVRVWYFRR